MIITGHTVGNLAGPGPGPTTAGPGPKSRNWDRDPSRIININSSYVIRRLDDDVSAGPDIGASRIVYIRMPMPTPA